MPAAARIMGIVNVTPDSFSDGGEFLDRDRAIAHDPRESIDDEAANQCQRYRSGEAHHCVELNIDGQLIRAE